MNEWIGLLAVGETVGYVEKALAVIGGFVIGGLLTGLLVQVITRLSTGQKVPRWVLHTLRLLGGIAVGWLVLLWVMGGGGSGLGGSGGFGFGPGSGSGTSDEKGKPASKTNEKPPDKERPGSAGPTPLSIEVLSNDTLRGILKDRYDPQHCYRVRPPDSDRATEGVRLPDNTRLLTLREIKKLVDPEGEPAWRTVILVLFEDSPDRDVDRVRDLKSWTESLRVKNPSGNVKVKIDDRFGKAPLN